MINVTSPVPGGPWGNRPFSDSRLKTAITKLDRSPSGYPIYRFAYKADPSKFYKGVMAQDLLEMKPEAVVTGADGSYRVNYDLLDVVSVWNPPLDARRGKTHRSRSRRKREGCEH